MTSVLPRAQRGDKVQGSLETPVPSRLGREALITFNENSQVLPGNYPQEAYCQAGARTQHKQNPVAMRWVIQL